MNNNYFDEDEKYDAKLGIIIGFILLCIAILMASGCSFVKDIQKAKEDKVETSKQDSGSVSKTETKSQSTDEWYRETLKMWAGKKDTNVTNIIMPDGQPAQPPYITVIREGGKSTAQTTTLNYDSLWKARFDSLSAQLQTKNNQSESKFGEGIVLAVAAVVVVVFIILIFWVQYNMNRNSKVITQVIEKITKPKRSEDSP